MNELRALNRRAMGSMNLWLIVLLLSIFFLAAIQECYADSAEVLPQGRSAVFVEGKFYLPVTKQYDEDGNKEKIADEYNTTLNSNVFPALGPLGAAFGFAPIDESPGNQPAARAAFRGAADGRRASLPVIILSQGATAVAAYVIPDQFLRFNRC